MNQHQSIHKITLAAAITAIYIAFLFLYKMIFLNLDSFLFILLPIPAAFYSYKHGSPYAFLPVVSSTLLSFLFIEFLQTIFFVFPGILLGCIYGLLIKKNTKPFYLLLFLFILQILLSFTSDILLANLLGYNLIEDFKSFILNLCDVLKINQHYLQMILLSILPGYFIVSGIISTLVVYLGVDLLLLRFNMKEKKQIRFPSYKHRINQILCWIYIILFSLSIFFLLVTYYLFSWMEYGFIVAFNLLIILSLYMIYLGLIKSAIRCQKNNQKILYLLIVLSILIFPFYLIVEGIVFAYKGH